MHEYTEQATIQWAIPGLLRGPANGQITARRPAVMAHIASPECGTSRRTDWVDLGGQQVDAGLSPSHAAHRDRPNSWCLGGSAETERALKNIIHSSPKRRVDEC
jgi:hypothetical protein